MASLEEKVEQKRRALGRGLEALLPTRPAAPSSGLSAAAAPDPVDQTGTPRDIPVDLIDRNPFQTRATFDADKLSELAQSIRATGVVQPITVRPLPNGRFQLINGERRLLASKEAGQATIPAILREVSDEQAMEMTIVENLQRADLNPIEQARAYQRLSNDFRMTQEQMAIRTGKERASVTNFLRLLRLPEDVQHKVETGELSFGHAKTLLGLSSQEQMASVAKKILALSLSVRQAETYVHGLMTPDGRPEKVDKVKEPLDPNVRDARDRLERALGMRVRIQDKRGRGRVIIEYSGIDDFDLLMRALKAD